MEQLLFVLVALVLVSFSSGQDFCHQKKCPSYQVEETNKDFEVRLYAATDWITTKVDGKAATEVVAASQRLKNFCERQKEAGQEIQDAWPALLTVTGDEDNPDVSMSWFVHPGLKPEILDTSVTLQHRDATTVYVRSFGGMPSIESGRENAKILREALAEAGKAYNSNSFVGAAYDSYFSLTHHNEIWIYAA
ncbi:heme-binding protein soul2 [Cololabis saira]|uniref:heme-binding protein soul2 n=1 Tax=Cololabis saira TaxID=129043 RepID=UPI002AD23525|nr:heme-binding protein soul2 [Cololabis saira]